MRCEFQLLRADEGMKAGGEGRCQLPSGKTIKAAFPPSWEGIGESCDGVTMGCPTVGAKVGTGVYTAVQRIAHSIMGRQTLSALRIQD
jgi:hypothetical protein